MPPIQSSAFFTPCSAGSAAPTIRKVVIVDRSKLVIMAQDAADAASERGEMTAAQLRRMNRRCNHPELFSNFWDRVESEMQVKPEFAACTSAAGEFDWEKFFELLIKYLPIILSFFM
jgi:hypothetical protein